MKTMLFGVQITWASFLLLLSFLNTTEREALHFRMELEREWIHLFTAKEMVSRGFVGKCPFCLQALGTQARLS